MFIGLSLSERKPDKRTSNFLPVAKSGWLLLNDCFHEQNFKRILKRRNIPLWNIPLLKSFRCKLMVSVFIIYLQITVTSLWLFRGLFVIFNVARALWRKNITLSSMSCFKFLSPSKCSNIWDKCIKSRLGLGYTAAFV